MQVNIPARPMDGMGIGWWCQEKNVKNCQAFGAFFSSSPRRQGSVQLQVERGIPCFSSSLQKDLGGRLEMT